MNLYNVDCEELPWKYTTFPPSYLTMAYTRHSLLLLSRDEYYICSVNLFLYHSFNRININGQFAFHISHQCTISATLLSNLQRSVNVNIFYIFYFFPI